MNPVAVRAMTLPDAIATKENPAITLVLFGAMLIVTILKKKN